MRRQRFTLYADNIANIGEAIERGRRNGTNPDWILEYRNKGDHNHEAPRQLLH
ncbi:hypothetical protein [Mesorhizobium prunaredense]|uniref:hypothetical protein n=1 Tax=Mesorhizobium prunaredense TaxID=1631249 RepID=UPI001FCCF7E1|nr:hypothetical protein [Mesorhizobium prunaredense]